MEYLVVRDFEYFGELLLKKDEVIDVKDNKVNVESSMGQIALDFSKVEEYLKKLEPLDIKVKEFSEDPNIIKDYRLVLDFKTTKAKSIELENFLRREIPKYI
jgi:hypothetical protein